MDYDEENLCDDFEMIQSLIAEYEEKYPEPTLEGFSGFIARKKSLVLRKYREMKNREC